MRHTCFQFPTNVLEQKEKKQFVLSRVFPFRSFFFWISSFENFPYQQFFRRFLSPEPFLGVCSFKSYSLRGVLFLEFLFQEFVISVVYSLGFILSGIALLGICPFKNLFFRFFQWFFLPVFSLFGGQFFWQFVLSWFCSLRVCSFTVLLFTSLFFNSFVL